MKGRYFKFFVTFACHLKHHTKHNSYKPVLVLLKQSDILRGFGGETICLSTERCQPALSLEWWWLRGGGILVFSHLPLYPCSCPATSSIPTFYFAASNYLRSAKPFIHLANKPSPVIPHIGYCPQGLAEHQNVTESILILVELVVQRGRQH